MPRMFLFLALASALLLLPTAAGGQSGSANRGPVAKDMQSRISDPAGKPATTPRVPARLARVRVQQQPASALRVADSQPATQTSSVPTSSASTAADDGDEVAEDDEPDENDDHSSTGDVDDEEEVAGDHGAGNVDDEADDDQDEEDDDDDEDEDEDDDHEDEDEDDD